MNELVKVEHEGQRVLTTAQLAESYGTDERRISENYQRNMTRYTKGKHYYLLSGDLLEGFKSKYANCGIAPNVGRLYLWTEKGAWLHAKSLNTDRAWQAYETLVDEYYRVKDMALPQVANLSPELQMFSAIFQSVAKMELEQKQITAQLTKFEEKVAVVQETFLQCDENWREGINKMLNAVANDGKKYQQVRADSYRRLEERAGCNLNQRLRNLRERLQREGATKTKIDSVNRLDVIEQEKRLRAIYETIVKEMSLARV